MSPLVVNVGLVIVVVLFTNFFCQIAILLERSQLTLNIKEMLLCFLVTGAHGRVRLSEEIIKKLMAIIVVSISPELVESKAIYKGLVSSCTLLVASDNFATLIDQLIGPAIQESRREFSRVIIAGGGSDIRDIREITSIKLWAVWLKLWRWLKIVSLTHLGRVVVIVTYLDQLVEGFAVVHACVKVDFPAIHFKRLVPFCVNKVRVVQVVQIFDF